MARTDPHEGLGFVGFADSLRDTFQSIMLYVHGRLAQEGFGDVRPAHMSVFQHLDPEGSRIGELAERAQMTNQSIGSLVDYLAEQGYVERQADPRNRRATRVCLTERGWSEMRACSRILAELEGKLVHTFGGDRLTALRAEVGELQHAMQDLKSTNNSEPTSRTATRFGGPPHP
jgi:DNA-binding MarR family transcriptional regulator